MCFKKNKASGIPHPFFRITESSASPSSKTMVEKLRSLQLFIQELIDILKIELPNFRIVGGLYKLLDNNILVQYEFRTEELPPYTLFNSIASYIPDDSNTIYLAEHIAILDKEAPLLHLVQFTCAELLFTIAHELRHIWQRDHYGDSYKKFHAFGTDVIDDFFEIDADAFATAYVFSSKTTFSHNDFPNVMENICQQAYADNGKRWSLSYELSKQYAFGDTEKIDSAKSSYPLG